MKYFRLLLIFVFDVFTLINASSDRMINGTRAKIGQFPFAVALIWETGTVTCSGTLIRRNYVLAAAHCFRYKDNDKPGRYAMAGDVEAKNQGQPPKSRQMLRVINTKVHPNCQTPQGKLDVNFDIAVSKLNGSFTLTNTVAPIPLAEKDMKPGEKCIGIGFGRFQRKNPGPYLLRYADFYVEKNCDPKKTHYSVLREGVSIFVGDSGGPLVNAKPPYYVYGALSVLAGRNIGKYSSSLRSKDWILEQIGSRSRLGANGVGKVRTPKLRALQAGLFTGQIIQSGFFRNFAAKIDSSSMI